MARLTPKAIQKELEQKKLRSAYWIYGPERLMARELFKRLQKVILEGTAPNDFNFEKMDGSSVSFGNVQDAVQSLSMMGGTRLVQITSADDLSDLDDLPEWLKQAGGEWPSIPVFISDTLDARRKWTKILLDHPGVAAIECEAVAEQDRDPWTNYLAKRRGLALFEPELAILRSLDPWSLDRVDQELGKLELNAGDPAHRMEALSLGIPAHAKDEVLEAIFTRNHREGLKLLDELARHLEDQLPLLGLIGWHARQLKVLLLESSGRHVRRNPYLEQKLFRWKSHWSLSTLSAFEERLFEIDFSLKNTRLTSLGLWSSLV